MYIRKLIFVSVLAGVFFIPTQLHAQPAPGSGFNGDGLSQCTYYYQGTNVINQFSANGAIHKITYKKQLFYDVGTNNVKAWDQDYYYQMQSSQEFGNHPSYYITIQGHGVTNRPPTPDAPKHSAAVSTLVFYTQDTPPQIGVSPTQVEYDNGGSRKKVWIDQSDRDKYDSNDTFGKYLIWLTQDTSPCSFTTDPAGGSTTAGSSWNANNNANGLTVSISEMQGATEKARWYLVAHGAWNQNTGFIYRKANANDYILVYGGSSAANQKSVVSIFHEGSSQDWEAVNPALVVADFKEPVPVVSNSEAYNHLKIPGSGDAGNKLLVTFPEPLKDPGDLNTLLKDITIEAQLNSEKGPYIGKDTIGLLDGGSGTYDKSTDSTGFKVDMLILAKKDLEKLYSPGSVPADHQNSIIGSLVICAHKTLNTGFAVGSVKLTLTDSSKNFSDGPGSIKKLADEGDAVVDWTTVKSPLTIEAKKNSIQTCGTKQDQSVAANAADAAAALGDSLFKSIQESIINALRAIGQLIQNLILYLVQWLVTLASAYVPI